MPRTPAPRSVRRGCARPRLQDVADAAGVSITTASFVMSDRWRGQIAEDTAVAVQAAAERLGYVPSHLARGLAHGRTSTIGLIVPDLGNAYEAGLVSAIEEAASDDGLRVLLVQGRTQAEREARAARELVSRLVDGLLLITDCTPQETAPWLSGLIRSGLAVVVIDEREPGLSVDTVTSDDLDGMDQLMRHLLARGHRRFAYIGGGIGRSTARDRKLAFTRATRDVTATVLEGASHGDGCASRIPGLIAGTDRPTALVCANDWLAAEAVRTVERHGLVVGRDIAVTGYGDIPFISELFGLTTVRQDTAMMGRRALDRLCWRREHPGAPAQSLSEPVRLVVRESG